METVTFEHEDKTGRYQCHKTDGSQVLVEGGKPYSTDDPEEIALLDAADPVKRVKQEKS